MDPDAIVLFQALADRSPVERERYYAQHQVSAVLRAEVESLLHFDRNSTDSMEDCVASVAEGVLRGTPADTWSANQPPLVPFRAGSEFCGTDRFTVRRQLGAGGMGVVYEVHDQARNEVVALKTLLRAGAADIYRLKREFRSLTDIAHTNLVSLYELVVDGANCFFTMELVEGVNFVEFVRGAAAPRDTERIKSVIRQLAEGVGALHRRGKLHRDIKPSNILVTSRGRVVILDFGLARDAYPNDAATWESMAGTPAYLAPERRAGAAPAESHDWYSVGVTLYEAFTGHLPFGDRFEHVLPGERARDSRPPDDVAPNVPEELNAICMGLLRRDPVHRFSGSDVLQLLERDAGVGTGTRPSDADLEPPFIGRRRYLDALDAGLRAAQGGCATAIYVHGPPGIGKSTLVQCFLEDVISRENVIVLRGRCHEHESVPYKALDGVIDSLSQHLSGLPRSQAELLLPSDVTALSRLFPVMLQVKSVASAYRRVGENAEPFILRQRAFAALRELLSRVAAKQPLILFIDDLHWADADSAVLLEELFRPPQAPPILTVACFRTEEIASKPFLQRLLERGGSKTITLPLDPMTDDEAETLLASVMPTDARIFDASLLEIAHEARGNPFLLRQLAAYLATHHVERHRATFADVMEDRLRSLPHGAQQFLETLAICGRPMDPDLVHHAVGLDGEARPLIARLRAAQFLRSSGSARRVELYHDRIREAIAAKVSSENRRQLHGQMARTLVARGADEPDALFEHFREADESAEASKYAVLAAKKADAALAFDRAAGYYRAALELRPEAQEHLEWTQRLAAALANAGRPTEAADVYLAAVGDADPTRRVELQRRCAEQLLIGGHIDRGLEVIRAVLSEVGIRFPMGPRMTLVSLMMRRAQLRWRGVEFVAREADRIPAEDLLRIDTCWSVTTGLLLVDNMRGALFHTRHLLLALDAGEPYRIARGMAIEVGYSAVAGGPGMQRRAELVERARTMAEKLDNPHAMAMSTLGAGMAAYLVGQWRRCTLLCDRALAILRDRCVGVTWELTCAQNFLLGSLLYEGQLHEVSRRLPVLLATAREHGNRYFETELCTRMTLVWLAADDPDEGERQATDVIERWSHEGFHRQHYNHVLARIQTELYRGRARPAWQLIAENWTAVKRSLLLRIQWVRIEASYVRARCALLMAASGRDFDSFLSVARNETRRIERERMPWSDPLAWLLDAAVAYLEGNTVLAEGRLARAAEGFDLAGMGFYGAVARRRRGALLGGDRGRELVRKADDWMAAQGIVNASRITRLIAPGFPDDYE
jgi:predicted Ser/Thr protein kinase/tetratricopeptide (TPR) repeat protein